MNIRNTPRSQSGMLFSTRFTELFVKNNSRQRMNFPSENSTIISALAHSAQTYFWRYGSCSPRGKHHHSAPTLRLSVCSSALQHLCNNNSYRKVYFIVIKSAFSSDSYFADFSYTCESAFSSDSCFADFSYTCESAFSSDSCFADFSYACKSAFLSDSCFADFFLHLHIRTCMILCYNKVYFFTA